MDIVVKGRQIEVSDRFRDQAGERLAKLERFDPKIQRVDVEVSKELNPRLADRALKVQLTIRSRGPVVRAEAAAADQYSALDVASTRLEARLRKAADRRNDHHRRGRVASDSALDAVAVEEHEEWAAEELPDGDQPMAVREKTHVAAPMTLDEALEAMELVGHDFYLYVDAGTQQPSVVYRRRGYHYGVIHLVPADSPAAGA